MTINNETINTAAARHCETDGLPILLNIDDHNGFRDIHLRKMKTTAKALLIPIIRGSTGESPLINLAAGSCTKFRVAFEPMLNDNGGSQICLEIPQHSKSARGLTLLKEHLVNQLARSAIIGITNRMLGLEDSDFSDVTFDEETTKHRRKVLDDLMKNSILRFDENGEYEPKINCKEILANDSQEERGTEFIDKYGKPLSSVEVVRGDKVSVVLMLRWIHLKMKRNRVESMSVHLGLDGCIVRDKFSRKRQRISMTELINATESAAASPEKGNVCSDEEQKGETTLVADCAPGAVLNDDDSVVHRSVSEFAKPLPPFRNKRVKREELFVEV